MTDHPPDRVPDRVPDPVPDDLPDETPDDPFAALAGSLGGLGGAGGFDMGALLHQAQQMQEQLQQAQEELAETTVDGTVADGAVTVRLNGVGELLGVEIKAGQFDGSDADDLTDLGDMLVAAYRDAKAQADALAGERLGPFAQGLGSGTGAGGPGTTGPGTGGPATPFGFGS